MSRRRMATSRGAFDAARPVLYRREIFLSQFSTLGQSLGET